MIFNVFFVYLMICFELFSVVQRNIFRFIKKDPLVMKQTTGLSVWARNTFHQAVILF